MSKPTQSIFPIENGKLITDLDCNNLLLLNLDTSNLGGLGGGSGNDTGTTTAILKGDGSHGFADAVADSDYATPGAVALKESQSTHDADILTLTTAVDATEADIATLTTTVGTKASTAALTAGLALKADDADLQAYITSNDADVALKAYTSDITTALGNKADAASTSAALAGKEPLLPTTANDRYILARRDSSGTDAWFFVDPVTLGTTSQTFANGQSFTNTNYDSATANFVSTDIGKTIVSAGVIPDDTTIVSVTSVTRVVLSAPTLSTATGETFTIINRLLTNNAGTVTSVSLTNNVTSLFSSSVSNPTSSPTITLNPATGVGANTFYGNFTAFAGTAGFGSASAARASLGGTTVGQALFQLASPSAITFPRINADNTVTARSAANMLLDLGAENALTFSTPLTRSTNIIGIQVATVAQSGYLSNSDWSIFNGKVAGTRTITTTAPLTGGGSLASDRTFAIPAATASVDGYLTQGDFTTFTAKPPNTRTISTTAPLSGGGDLSANRTLAIAKATAVVDGYLAAADFSAFSNQVPVVRQAGFGGTLTLADVAPPITRVILNSVLTSPLVIVLPPSVSYGSGIGFPFIEIVDLAGGAQANFGVTVNRSGTDLIDVATSITLPRSVGYLRINSNGFNRWTTTKYSIDSFRDPLDPTKKVVVDLSSQTTGTTNTFIPATAAPGGSVTEVIADTGENRRFVTGFSLPHSAGDANGGVLSRDMIHQRDILLNQDDINDATDIVANSHTVPNTGDIANVRLSFSLTSPLTIVWPDAANYQAGIGVTFYDTSGSISPSRPVTIVGANGNTFNGSDHITITDSLSNRTFRADRSTGSWTVANQTVTISPFTHVTGQNGVFTITPNPIYPKQNAQLILAAGVNSLAVPNPFDGMELECVLFSADNTSSLNLPSVSRVAGAAGVITLSGATGAYDMIRGNYVGELATWFWDQARLNYLTAALPAAPSSLTATAISSSRINLGWTDNASNETGFEIVRSTDNVTFTTLTSSVAVNAVTYSDQTVQPSTTYYYKVRAVNTGGSSNYSNTANATTSSAALADLLEWHLNDGSGTFIAHTVGPDGTLVRSSWTTSTQSGSGAALNFLATTLAPSAPVVAATGTGTTNYQYKLIANINDGTHTDPSTSASTVVTNTATLVPGTNFNTITIPAIAGVITSYDVYRTTGSAVGKIGNAIAVTSFVDSSNSVLVAGTPPVSTSNYVATPTSSITCGATITVSFWFNTAYVDGSNTPVMFTLILGTTTNRIYYSGTKIGVRITGSSSGSREQQAPAPSASNWHHVAAVIDRSTGTGVIKIYIDGSLQTLTTVGTPNLAGNAAYGAVTPQFGSSRAEFKLDDIRIYNSEQSGAQILNLFNGGAS